MNNPNMQPLYKGKGKSKKIAAITRSNKGSQTISNKNGDPGGLIANCKKR